MKKIATFTSVLALLAMSFTFTSCKKGSGDPFLTLKSRKGRVAGEWKATKLEFKSNYTNSYSNNQGGSSTSSGNFTLKIEGGNATYNSSENDNGDIMTENHSGTGEYTITFEKDGTFKGKMSYYVSGTTNFDGNSINTKRNNTEERTGVWNFVGGQEKDFKNKERIMLSPLTLKGNTSTEYDITGAGIYSMKYDSDDTFASGENAEIWVLGTLKGKLMEATMSGKSTNKYNYTESFMGQTGSETGNSSSEFTATLTLEQ